MRRDSIARVIAILVAAMLGSQASAQNMEPRYWDVSGVGPDDVLIVHSSGSVRSSIVELLPADAVCLKNLGCKGGLTPQEYRTLTEAQRQALLRKRPRWCRVSFGSRHGWVSQRFLVKSVHGCMIDRRI